MPDRKPGLTRRDFLAAAAATAAGALSAPRAAGATRPAARGHAPGANDRIAFAVAGTGGAGRRHLLALVDELSHTDNVEVVAIAEASAEARDAARRRAGLCDGRAFANAFDMIATVKGLDAVVVATPDGSRADLAIAVLERGRHVYIETPMCWELEDAFRLQDVAAASRAIVQSGAASCSDPRWLEARDLVRSGRLGPLMWAQGCGGEPGAWTNDVSALMLAMDIDEPPARVSCLRSSGASRAAGVRTAPSPEHGQCGGAAGALVTAEFPGGATLFLADRARHQRGIDGVISGRDATAIVGDHGLRLQPAGSRAEVHLPAVRPAAAGPAHVAHMRDFIRSMRGSTAPNCGIALAVRVQALIAMANASYERERSIRFDAEGRRMA